MFPYMYSLFAMKQLVTNVKKVQYVQDSEL